MKMLGQFSHNCLKTVSKSLQFVFILFLWILNMSDFERSSFGKNGKSIILPVQNFVWGQMFFLEKNFNFVNFLHFGQNTFTRRRWTFRQSSPICVFCVQKEFLEENIPRKNLLQLLFWLWAKRFQTFSSFTQLALHKIHFLFPEQNVGVKKCLRKKEFSICFTILYGRISHFRRRWWVNFLTTALKSCQSLFNMFSSTFYGFWTCQILNEVLLVRKAKASFYQSRFLSEEKCFSKKAINLSFSCILGKRLSHVGRKHFGILLHFAFYMFRKSFWKKIFLTKKLLSTFFDIRQNVSRLSAAFFGLAFHKFHLSFLEQKIGVTNCLKNKEIMFFPQLWAEGFRTSDKTVESILSQLP